MPGRRRIWSQTSPQKRPTERAKAMEKARNTSPTQWGRRLARLVGDKFGVKMSDNHSKNVGTWQGKEIVIKCAKSPMPPVSVLLGMLDNIDCLWAVYVMPEGHAEIWMVDMHEVRRNGYFTQGAKVQKRVEITRRKVTSLGIQLGTLSARDVDSCQIP